MLAEKLTSWEITQESSPSSQIKPVKKQLPLASGEFHSIRKGEGQDSVHGGGKGGLSAHHTHLSCFLQEVSNLPSCLLITVQTSTIKCCANDCPQDFVLVSFPDSLIISFRFLNPWHHFHGDFSAFLKEALYFTWSSSI